MTPHYRIHGPGQLHEGSWAPPGVGAAVGAAPFRGGFAAEKERQEQIQKAIEEQAGAAGAHKRPPESDSSPEVASGLNSDDVPVHMELVRWHPFTDYTLSVGNSETYEALLVALSGDTLSLICNILGLKHFDTMARVCTSWHDAIRTKMREWGVLTHMRTLGKGFGKLRGQFDMPTWLSLLPDGQLAVVDSCNYRLQIIQPGSGVVSKVVGRPGARPGQLSSPSSVAYSPTCGPRRVFASSNVGPQDRRVMAFDLQTWNLVESTPEGTGKTELDAPEGMTVSDGKIFVVDTANHRIAAFDMDSLEKVATYPPVWWARTGRSRQGRAWDQLDCPQDIAAHDGELFVSDTHNDRIQVFSTELNWIGVIGCKGRGAGQFVYPRGVCVAGDARTSLLYVCEEARIQALTLLGEPRIVLPVPGAVSLCGIVSDGERRVYCTDSAAARLDPAPGAIAQTRTVPPKAAVPRVDVRVFESPALCLQWTRTSSMCCGSRTASAGRRSGAKPSPRRSGGALCAARVTKTRRTRRRRLGRRRSAMTKRTTTRSGSATRQSWLC